MTSSLLPEEAIVLTARRHWIALIHPLAGPVLLGLGAAVPLVLLRSDLEIALMLALSLLVVAGFLVVIALARWAASELALTDRRVLVRSGLVARTTKVIALERIQDVSTQQSALGRVLRFGTLEIDAAGAGGHQVLNSFPAPERIRDAVFVTTAAARRRAAARE